MAIRLYESAWVELERHEIPLQVFKDRKDPAVFNIGDYKYDIDGRPMKSKEEAPAIVRQHSLQSAKDAGLRTDYRSDIYAGLKALDER